MTTITLTTGDDRYSEPLERASHDIIYAGAGDDAIFTFGTLSDRIYAGDGDDTVMAYSGGDIVFGGAGDDQIWLTGGSRADGGAGDDALYGSGQNDLLIGGAGNDDLFSGRGADTLLGGFGDDTFLGGKGADTYLSNSGPGDHDLIIFGHDGDRWQLPNHFSFRSLDSNDNNRLDAGDARIDTLVSPEGQGLHVDFDSFTIDLFSSSLPLLQIGHVETIEWGAPL